MCKWRDVFLGACTRSVHLHAMFRCPCRWLAWVGSGVCRLWVCHALLGMHLVVKCMSVCACACEPLCMTACACPMHEYIKWLMHVQCMSNACPIHVQCMCISNACACPMHVHALSNACPMQSNAFPSMSSAYPMHVQCMCMSNACPMHVHVHVQKWLMQQPPATCHTGFKSSHRHYMCMDKMIKL